MEMDTSSPVTLDMLTIGKRYILSSSAHLVRGPETPVGSLVHLGNRTIRVKLDPAQLENPSAIPLELGFIVPGAGLYGWYFRKSTTAFYNIKNSIEGRTLGEKHHLALARKGPMYASWARVHIFDYVTRKEVYKLFIKRKKEPLV